MMRVLISFAIPSELYELETMPIGLMNAPASFQRLMNQLLRDLIPTQCVVSVSVLSNGGALHLASYTIISGGTMDFNLELCLSDHLANQLDFSMCGYRLVDA